MPTYTTHAREQMRERRVSEAEVEAVLRARTWSRPSTGRKVIVTAVVAGRAIDVVIDPTVDPVRVITVIPH